MTSYPMEADVTEWTTSPLNVGEVFRFHLVAINSLGRSGNSPFTTTVAGVNPGLDYSLLATYSSEEQYRPIITHIEETSMTVCDS